MSAAQFTPGPWKAKQDRNSKFSRNHWTIEAASPHCPEKFQTVCELNGPWDASNYKANARLIAASPTMLEVLTVIAAQAELTARTFPNAAGRGDWLTVERLARQAIAKAEGRT